MSGFRQNLTTSTRAPKKKMAQPKKAKKRIMRVEEDDTIRKVQIDPKYEKVTTRKVDIDFQWMKEVVRDALAKKLKIQIPANADLSLDYEWAQMIWNGNAVPCKAPKKD